MSTEFIGNISSFFKYWGSNSSSVYYFHLGISKKICLPAQELDEHQGRKIIREVREFYKQFHAP